MHANFCIILIDRSTAMHIFATHVALRKDCFLCIFTCRSKYATNATCVANMCIFSEIFDEVNYQCTLAHCYHRPFYTCIHLQECFSSTIQVLAGQKPESTIKGSSVDNRYSLTLTTGISPRNRHPLDVVRV